MAHVAGTTSVRPPSHRARLAFTLVELMVVVSILALLALMLMPALQKAMEAGRIANCSGNLKAQGLAWRCYLSDNKETFPQWFRNMDIGCGGLQPALCESPPGKGQMNTPLPAYRPLNPYLQLSLTKVKQAPYFRCPSDHGLEALNAYSSTYKYTCYDWFGSSYRGNWLLMIETDPLTYRPTGYYAEYDGGRKYLFPNPFRLSMLKMSPSVTILGGDAPWMQSVCDVQTVWSRFHSSDDRMNLLFVDGHVRYTKIRRGVCATGEYSQLPYPEMTVAP